MKKFFIIFVSLVFCSSSLFASSFSDKDVHGNTALHRTVSEAGYYDNVSKKSIYLESVKTIIKSGVDINAQGSDKYAALHIAVQNNNLEIVKELLAHGAKVNLKDGWGRTPLFYAESGAIVSELISRKADTNNIDQWKVSALQRTIRRGHVDVAKILIDHGAKVNTIDEWGCSSIHAAAAANENGVEILEMLLKQGANINAACTAGETPFYYAVGNVNLESVKFLLKNGAEFSEKTEAALKKNRDFTILDVAKSSFSLGMIKPITMADDPEIIKQKKEILDLLLEALKKK